MPIYSDTLTGFGGNALTGGTASAFSFFSAGFEAAKAADQNTTTRWAAALPLDTVPHAEWYYDFGVGNAVRISRVGQQVYIASVGSGDHCPIKDSSLCASDNGTTYTYIGHFQQSDQLFGGSTTANTTNPEIYDITGSASNLFANEQHRYWAISITSYWCAPSQSYPSVWEYQMFEGLFGPSTILSYPTTPNYLSHARRDRLRTIGVSLTS